MTFPIASLSISARLTLDLHSLNNEGTEGNITQTRRADIVGPDGQMHNVNAITGDVLKHVQTRHFFELAREADLPLCAACARLDPNRLSADPARLAELPSNQPAAFSALLAGCAIDDTAGVLVAISGHRLSRKGVVEFGWAVGIPPRVMTGSYFHVRFVPTNQGDPTAAADQFPPSGTNQGQMVFYRPASSGIYAVVCHVELWRIGYNEFIQSSALAPSEQRLRAALVLQSVLHTLIEVNGAMRSTQLPHVLGLEGILTWSRTRAIPAPFFSAIAGGVDSPTFYQDQIRTITTALNGRGKSVVTAQEFATSGDYATQLSELIDEIMLDQDT